MIPLVFITKEGIGRCASASEKALNKVSKNWGRLPKAWLILRLLTRRVGELSDSTIEHINQLSVESLESLGEALLDFDAMADLHQWLTDYQQQNQPDDFQTQAD